MRILGGLLTAMFGAPFLLFAVIALNDRFGPARDDPHGYQMIFGTLFAVALSLPLLLSVPLVFPKERRGDGALWAGAAIFAVDVLLIAALMTA